MSYAFAFILQMIESFFGFLSSLMIIDGVSLLSAIVFFSLISILIGFIW